MSLANLAPLKPYLSSFHSITMWVLVVVFYAMYLGVPVWQTRLAAG